MCGLRSAAAESPSSDRRSKEPVWNFFSLPSRPLPHGHREAVSFVVENLAGYMAASRFLREEHVTAVVGLGGYVSVPMGRAAIRRDVPLVLLEQNAVPAGPHDGLLTKLH